MDEKDRDKGIVSPDTQNFEEQYGHEMQDELREIEFEYTEEEPEENPEDDGAPKKKKKKRKKKHGFLWFCVIVIIAAAVIVFMNSSFFGVDRITVKGSKNYSVNEIVKMSGVKEGDNIFRIFGGTVEKNLKKDSYVQAADIERKLPGELIIRVTERKEAAYLVYGKEYVIIDDHGYVLNTTSKKPELTMIDDMTIKSMNKGELLETDQDSVLKDAISIIKLMKKEELFFKRISVGKVVVRAYVYDDLVCKGIIKNVKRAMKDGDLEEIIYDLYKKGVKKGTVNIGSGKYCSYSPKVE
ncbi:MAG: FtsQ-type POTRA domain-containing protein [Eubacteriaceae bacterium]|nr:FtsQ-type POTRA domain-containing protein [Eubacteriaceae bacterium]